MNQAQPQALSPAAPLDPHRIVVAQRAGWVPETLTQPTLARLFWDRVDELGDEVMMRQKDLGIWKSHTWREVGRTAEEIGAGLVSLGLAVGDVVGVLANTSREWMWVDLAAQGMGAAVCGIYPTDAPEQVQYLCEDSATRFLFVEDEEQLDKWLEVREHLPRLERVIVFDMEGLSGFADERVMSLEALRERGRAELQRQPELLRRRLDLRSADDLAVLVYTSGTTGKPKGAMITNGNLISALAGTNPTLFEGMPEPVAGAREERIAFLPLCHIAERLIGGYIPILRRSVVNFVENPETVFENMREVQPHVMFAVPRVWEKMYSSVMIALREAGKIQQAAYAWALGCGQAVARAQEEGREPSAAARLKLTVANALVLGNVRRMLGLSRVRLALTGAAPISPELIRWYRSLGVQLREGWGMTETTAAGIFTPAGRYKPGSIGQAAPGVEVRIAPLTHEILLRGPVRFAGYLNLPEKTAEAIDAEGWLHTGDVGRVDDEGWITITDRMKDIIITAGGKNITPSELENELKFSPYITDAVVIGDRRPYLSLIVMIDQDNVEKFAQERDVPFSNYASLTRAPEVIELIQGEVDKVNAKFARVEQIKKFFLLDKQLTAEDEELTPTMKLKRKLVEKKYAERIEAMYR